MSKRPRLAIVGGGASGMAAALEAAHRVDVVLYEGHSRLGRKLLATGNGRCNFSHQGFTDANYHGTIRILCMMHWHATMKQIPWHFFMAWAWNQR